MKTVTGVHKHLYPSAMASSTENKIQLMESPTCRYKCDKSARVPFFRGSSGILQVHGKFCFLGT